MITRCGSVKTIQLDYRRDYESNARRLLRKNERNTRWFSRYDFMLLLILNFKGGVL
jgi:hypothetical protein